MRERVRSLQLLLFNRQHCTYLWLCVSLDKCHDSHVITRLLPIILQYYFLVEFFVPSHLGKEEMGSNEEFPVCEDTVIVTGFGPFGVHKINSSMEAVKLLRGLEVERELGIQLVTKEIPVEYDYVKNEIPILWQLYKPKVMISIDEVF